MVGIGCWTFICLPCYTQSLVQKQYCSWSRRDWNGGWKDGRWRWEGEIRLNTPVSRTNPNACACVHAKSLQSRPALCDPMDYSLPSSSVWILHARILEWVAMPSSTGSPDPGMEFVSPVASALQPPIGGFFTYDQWGKPQKLCYLFNFFCVFFSRKKHPSSLTRWTSSFRIGLSTHSSNCSVDFLKLHLH